MRTHALNETIVTLSRQDANKKYTQCQWNDAGAKQNYAPTLADLYAVASLDSVLYAIHDYSTKFLHRCALKCTI